MSSSTNNSVCSGYVRANLASARKIFKDDHGERVFSVV